jgi:hypothetical protein
MIGAISQLRHQTGPFPCVLAFRGLKSVF